VCKKKDIIFQVSAVHDAMVEEYRSNQHKKYRSGGARQKVQLKVLF